MKYIMYNYIHIYVYVCFDVFYIVIGKIIYIFMYNMRILCVVCAKFHLHDEDFFKKNFAEFNTVATEGGESLEAPNIFEYVLLFLLYYHAMCFLFLFS